ncbi:MAG TPA: phenylalanine--tRNA ligase subunit beta [Sandaracinaceae bacterium LLY-WYZ-13_1]|nr:phenylalanine--tRNA ligase subunit beta [Sandaracinaceae bacterium LLY-WYZ-13_1]
MLASHRWLKELSGVDASPDEVAERLTQLGLEVEDVHAHGTGLEHVVVAEVRAAEPVPDKDKLRLVTVFDGQGERKVICGAPNVPEPGGRVVLAEPGAVLPGGFEIAERKVGGVLSSGMLCSETELAIGAGSEGILVLSGGDAGAPGQPVAEALALEDHVFEIGLTPNRPDCLGHAGLARELALAFGAPFRMPSPGFPTRLLSGVERTEGPEELPVIDADERPAADTLTLVDPRPDVPSVIPIRIADPERCPRYAGGVIQGVKVRRSPFWLRYRLHVLGVRAIDAVVDVTNLVLFELGHPIHAFDLAKVRGPEIIVRLAEQGERMATLDGEARAFTADDLMICDAEGPVAVAGVMGGADSEIGEETRDVLIEVAYFDPRSVRRTSRRLGLHTDSSHRFERGVDPHGVPWAMRRAVSLICALADGAASPVARDVYPAPIPERQIPLAPAHVGRLLGDEVSEAECRRALEGIGCAISPGEETGWRVTAPTWRPDLRRPEDLVEEVGRVRGYDAVPTELPRVLPSGRGIAPRLRATRRLREAAADLGLLEAVNFSFVSRAELERARVSTDAVALANPLSEERAVMRTSLLPGLLADVARARRHQAGAVRLFEVARTYHPVPGEALPREPLELAIALAGPRVEHVGRTGELDFYDGKGALVSVLEAAFGAAPETVADDALDEAAPYLHPRRRARVRIGGRDVGVLGEVHPDVGDELDLDARVVYGAVDVEALLEAVRARGVPQASPLPRFPAVGRDLAVVVDEATEAGAVASVLREAGGALLEEVELFDVYRGQGVPDGHKSLAYRIVYRDPDATLTDKRVEKAHRGVVKTARERLGATVRE